MGHEVHGTNGPSIYSIILIVRISSNDSPILRHILEIEEFIQSGNMIVIVDATRKGLIQSPGKAIVFRYDKGSEVEQIDYAYKKIKEVKAHFIAIIDERAIFERCIFDEMVALLIVADRNAICSPRANCYPYFSLPYNNLKAMNDDEYGKKALRVAKRFLPDYSIVPFATSACFVARKDIVDNFGLFDPEISELDTAILDFCARINQFGYSSIMANHVFLKGEYSSGEANFEKSLGQLKNRYPYLSELLSEYFDARIDESDRFFELLMNGSATKKKVLFEFSIMPASYNGTSEFQIHLLEYFSLLYSSKYDFYVRVGNEASEYHDLPRRFPGMHFSDDFSGIYHIGMSATQPFYEDQIKYMSSHCLKIVFSILDIIMCRSDYLRTMDPLRDGLVRLGTSICDGMIAISDYTRSDFRSYFHTSPEVSGVDVRRILISTDVDSGVPSEDYSHTIPFNKYILIVGNRFRHKALCETLAAVRETDQNFVVVGLPADECLGKNIVGFDSGKLDDSFINYLYGNCSALLFPSVYEGYGLPIAIALRKGKKVVVHDNPLNRELCDSYKDVSHQFFFFKTFDEINSVLQRINAEKDCIPGDFTHTWRDAVVQVESYFQEILSRQAVPEKLNHRRFLVSLLESSGGHRDEASSLLAPSLQDLLVDKFLENHPLRYKAAKMLYRVYTRLKK